MIRHESDGIHSEARDHGRVVHSCGRARGEGAMKIVVPREVHPGETRAAMVPENVRRLVRLGARVEVETGLGTGCGWTDGDYRAAGAAVRRDREALLQSGDIVLRVHRPPAAEVGLLRPGSVHISFLDPFAEPDLVRDLAARGVNAVSLELLPRVTRAQAMDALTSQANLAGYAAVVLAAAHLTRVFPLMTTAAGTLAPARVLVIGAGVAGLQAIATARRLGARVEAFDTRAVAEQEVRSVGGRFLKIALGETGQDAGGHARPLTEEQTRLQRAALGRFCAGADVVITAAQVFGRRPPVLVSSAMIESMRHGSVVVDTAIEGGGNVEGAEYDGVIVRNGVTIVGLANLPGRVPAHASQVYSANLASFIEEFWDSRACELALNPDDAILKACLVTRGGTPAIAALQPGPGS